MTNTWSQLVGPAATQALLLARYQALRRIGEEVVQVDEGDVICQQPTREEERIMAFNASVVSALEDIFSLREKDRSSRTSQLLFVESWRFHRAMYRVWVMSTLFGYESAPRGQLPESTTVETQKAFLSKYTSQELIQIDKACRFLRSLASWAILAESQSSMMGSLEDYNYDSLSLFAGPHIILRCFEEQSSKPLSLSYIMDDEVYEGFLIHPLKTILSQRNVITPLAYVGSILDDVRGVHDMCHVCGQDGRMGLSSIQYAGNLYNENNWVLLKADLGAPSDIFFNLSSNMIERPLFKRLREAKYDTLISELFVHKGEPYQNWTRYDWVCVDCFREFFIQTVFRWWRVRKEKLDEPPDCRHGYYCKDQCFNQGLDHAKRFNHVCDPVDLSTSIAQLHGR